MRKPCKELDDILSRMASMGPGDIIDYEGVEIRKGNIFRRWMVGIPGGLPPSQHTRAITAAEKVRRLMKQLRKRQKELGQ